MIDARHYPEHNLLVVKIKGDVDLKKFLEWYAPEIEQVNREHAGQAPPNRIYDLRELKLDVSTDELRELIDWVNGFNHVLGPCRSVFLTESNLMYGLSRQFVEFGKNPDIERAVFRRADEALGWLGIDPAKTGFFAL